MCSYGSFPNVQNPGVQKMTDLTVRSHALISNVFNCKFNEVCSLAGTCVKFPNVAAWYCKVCSCQSALLVLHHFS